MIESYPSSDDIINSFYSKVDAAKQLTPRDYELVGQARIGGEKVSLPVDSIAGIQPGEEPGTIVMHLKQGIAENKGKLVLTGACLIALGALVLKRRLSN